MGVVNVGYYTYVLPYTICIIADRYQGREMRAFSHSESTKHTNETLLQHGFLGASPEKPSIAFSLEVFELYRQLHRACPRLSLDAFAKALNHLHAVRFIFLHCLCSLTTLFQVPHSPYLADQFSNSYDCYLEICRSLDFQVQVALKRDPKTWYMQNVCPPCLYKTESEPYLKYSFLAAMDGNNSLKLFDSDLRPGQQQADDRVSYSPRWITPEEVDQFKDEVATSQRKVSLVAMEFTGFLPEFSSEDSSGTE